MATEREWGRLEAQLAQLREDVQGFRAGWEAYTRVFEAQLAERVQRYETRLSALERWRSYLTGAYVALTLAVASVMTWWKLGKGP